MELNDEDRFEDLTEAANYYMTKIGRVSDNYQSAGSVQISDLVRMLDIEYAKVDESLYEAVKRNEKLRAARLDGSLETIANLKEWVQTQNVKHEAEEPEEKQ